MWSRAVYIKVVGDNFKVHIVCGMMCTLNNIVNFTCSVRSGNRAKEPRAKSVDIETESLQCGSLLLCE